jgi:hypothetical protein
MRSLIAAIAFILVGSVGLAQCQTVPAGPPRAKAAPSLSVEKVQTELTEAEAKFLADGPRLYPMDKALALSAETGKPVVCWMGKHIFADDKARAASLALADTTIQAAMDSDGTAYDRVGPRVKFSNTNYKDDATTYFVPVAKLSETFPKKILAVARGADPETVGLKVRR